MKKLLIGSILIISTNAAFAGIVNETTTAIGNAKDIHFERHESYEVSNAGLQPNFVQPNAHTHSYRANVNQNVSIASEHGFMIQNFTAKKQRYHFKYEVNCDREGTLHEGDVDVNANSTWYDKASLTFVTNKNREGVFNIRAETRVTGETGGYTFDGGTLTVRK
ncbi:MAG TPA: hypothetical protein VKG26_09495 [Bacteroidia bacterium]|nr:hypothetical protein [Bacteroidia bacterium]